MSTPSMQPPGASSLDAKAGPGAFQLPGQGYFGALDSDCLDVEVAMAVRSITLELAESAPTCLNLRGIELHGVAGPLALDGSDYEARMSSVHSADAGTAASGLMHGRSIHSRAELNPWWTVRFFKPLELQAIRVRNRGDAWGLRSRSLRVTVEAIDGRSVLLYDGLSTLARDASLAALYRALGPVRVASRARESSGDACGLCDDVLQALAVDLRSGSASLDSLPWRDVLALLDIWSGAAPSDDGWTVLAGFLLAQHRRREGVSIRAFSRLLANRVRLQRLERELNVLAPAFGNAELAVTRHGLGTADGLNRQPEQALAHLAGVVDALAAWGRKPVLAYGTLLGAVRESRFIPHDDDVDVLYVSAATDRAAVVDDLAGLRAQLQGRGYRVDSMLPSNLNMHVIDPVTEALVDIFPCWIEDGGLMLHMQRMELRSITPGIVHPSGSVELHGQRFPAPANPDAFLEARYGPDWKRSDPYFEWPWKLEETAQ